MQQRPSFVLLTAVVSQLELICLAGCYATRSVQLPGKYDGLALPHLICWATCERGAHGLSFLFLQGPGMHGSQACMMGQRHRDDRFPHLATLRFIMNCGFGVSRKSQPRLTASVPARATDRALVSQLARPNTCSWLAGN